MDSAQMLAHCSAAIEAGTGDKPRKQAMIGKIFSPFVRKGLLGEKPFPKNSPTDPAFVVSSEKDLEAERRRLMDLVNRFCELGARTREGRPILSLDGCPATSGGSRCTSTSTTTCASSARRAAFPTETLRFTYEARGPYSLAADGVPLPAMARDRGSLRRDDLPPAAANRASGSPARGSPARPDAAPRGGPPRRRRPARRRRARRRSASSTSGSALARRPPVLPVVPRRSLLADALRHSRGLRIAGTPSLWEAIVTAVLSQQINLAFAYDIRRELSIAFGRRARFDGETWFDFPKPSRIARETERALRKFRLSRAKAGTLLRTAKAFELPASSPRSRSPRSTTKRPSPG
jgi:hypothetical protein